MNKKQKKVICEICKVNEANIYLYKKDLNVCEVCLGGVNYEKTGDVGMETNL